MDIIDSLRAGQLRLQLSHIIGKHLFILGIFVHADPVNVLQRNAVVLRCLFIRLEQTAFCSRLQRHIGHGKAGFHTHLVCGRPCKFQGLVLASVGSQIAQDL